MKKNNIIKLMGCGFLLATHVYADGIVIHNQALDVTNEKIKIEFLAQPLEIQKKLKADEWGIRKFVDAIHNEALFEAEAEKEHLKDDPLVANKIAIAIRKVLIEELIAKQKQSIKVPDMEPLALAEYEAHPENYQVSEQLHARHILVTFDEKSKSEKMQFLKSLKKRIEKGEDFAELAKQYSEDKGSAVKGGDLGIFGKGQMVKPFQEAAFLLKKPKQLSEIIETQFGLHLIQLLERIPAKRRDFAEVKADLMAEREQEYLKNEMKTWRDTILDPKKATLNEAELEKVINEIKKLP